jgi:anti-sigma factor RsiW
MCNKEDLVAYLYDDLDGPSRLSLERHVRTCDACRDELAGMRAVRTDLLTWSPPEPDFAFRLVAEPKVIRPRVASWRAWLTPAAGLAAAAVLVLAAAAGLARIEVHSGPDGFTVRTGWSAVAPAAVQQSAVAGFGGRDVNLPVPVNLASIEHRIAALEAAARDGGSPVRSASFVNARASNEEVLKVVRDLLAQSEGRQKTELAFRIAQVLRDVEAQRVADLNRVQQGLGRIDATVADEAAAHRELMNYFLTTSTPTPRTK